MTLQSRTQLKRRVPLQASRMPLKRKIKLKTGSSTSAKKKALTALSKYIRLRDALLTTFTRESLRCITCGSVYPAFGKGCAQAGHFIPGRHGSNLFDERNVHGQCYICNVVLKGNWVKYDQAMRKLYGESVIEELKASNQILTHYKQTDYEEFERYFTEKYNSL